MENQRKPNVSKKISAEIGLEFLNLIFGNIYSKTGFSLLLFIIGLIFIFANMENEVKPRGLYLFGGLLILISILLISKRYLELKRKNEKL
jgi:hypothetical protein